MAQIGFVRCWWALTSRTTPQAAALGVRDLLAELGLRCWPKTSGSRVFHVVPPDALRASMWAELQARGQSLGPLLEGLRAMLSEAGWEQSCAAGAPAVRPS